MNLKCPSCGQELESEADIPIGQEAACPVCHSSFYVRTGRRSRIPVPTSRNQIRLSQRLILPHVAIGRYLSRLTPSGRAARSEVWWVFLLLFISHVAIFSAVGERNVYNDIMSLVTFWPTTCLLMRRFHDIERSLVWVWILALISILYYVSDLVLDLNELMPLDLILLALYYTCSAIILCCCCYKSVPYENVHGQIPNLIQEIRGGLSARSSHESFCGNAGGQVQFMQWMKHSRIWCAVVLGGIVLGVLVVAFACRYEIVTSNNKTIRINRFSGKTELFLGNMWVEIKEKKNSQKTNYDMTSTRVDDNVQQRYTSKNPDQQKCPNDAELKEFTKALLKKMSDEKLASPHVDQKMSIRRNYSNLTHEDIKNMSDAELDAAIAELELNARTNAALRSTVIPISRGY